MDQGLSFGDLFISISAHSNVEVQRTGVEAHSSLGIGEIYHHPLRITYRKLEIDYPSIEKSILLSIAVKAMNDSLGPEGLVPSALVFGEYPSVHTKSEVPSPRAALISRAEVANAARKEMEQIMARMRVQRALKHATPISADRAFEVGSEVLVWRENTVDNRIGEFVGPFKVLGTDYERRLVYVQDCKIGPARPFNIAQVKTYRTSDALSYAFVSNVGEGLREYRSPTEL